MAPEGVPVASVACAAVFVVCTTMLCVVWVYIAHVVCMFVCVALLLLTLCVFLFVESANVVFILPHIRVVFRVLRALWVSHGPVPYPGFVCAPLCASAPTAPCVT